MSNIQVYPSFTEEDADRESAEAAALSGNVFMDLEDGENMVRFLPIEQGWRSPYRKTALHYITLPGHEKRFVFACPRVELKEPCISCARAKELGSSKDAIDLQAAKDATAGFRAFSNVCNCNVPASGPVVLGFGKMVLGGLKTVRKSRRAGGDFTNPGPDGFNIIITKTGTGMSTTYAVQRDPVPSPLAATQDEIDFICEQRHDLNAQVQPKVPDALIAAWGNVTSRAYSIPAQPAQAQVARTAPAPTRPAGLVGASLVGATRPPAADPKQEYDDDFNPIVVPAPDDDDIPF